VIFVLVTSKVHSDDIQLDANLSKMFLGVPVVVTEKLDGGNCCLRDGNVYARTHKKPTSHESFSWIKQMYAGKKASMDPKLSFFGENLYAAHSIRYNRLESYFYLFAVRGCCRVKCISSTLIHTYTRICRIFVCCNVSMCILFL